ncbi:MAG: rRNA pseudouridine synthase [Treponema sp.]|nr:rRNA pseudouridine synthase [Treponema sp.]
MARTERLDKVLSNHGFGTRKDTRTLIHRGLVTLNGEVCRQIDAKVSIEEDSICVDGETLELCVHRTFMMNKAAGYVCSTKEGAHQTVFDLLDDSDRHAYLGGSLSLVGRLDVDTEGLLILTTDGRLNHALTSPKHHAPKTYLVYLENPVDEKERLRYRDELSKGIHIEPDGKEPGADCLPAEIAWDFPEKHTCADGKNPAAVCRLTISEGKFHQVKRMFAALGNCVVYLKRLSVNGLSLDPSLGPGEYRELSEDELNILSSNQSGAK